MLASLLNNLPNEKSEAHFEIGEGKQTDISVIHICGMKADEMQRIGGWMLEILKSPDDEGLQ